MRTSNAYVHNFIVRVVIVILVINIQYYAFCGQLIELACFRLLDY